jgi:hypothetical protein
MGRLNFTVSILLKVLEGGSLRLGTSNVRGRGGIDSDLDITEI